MATNIEMIKVGTTYCPIGVPVLTIFNRVGEQAKTVSNISWLSALTDLKAGMQVKLLLINGNSHLSPTLNINDLGAKNIVGYGGCAPANFSMANALVSLTYDGTQ